MKVSYPGKTIRIALENSNKGYSIIPKNDFDKLLNLGITRKKAVTHQIGSTLWNNSYNYHYSKEDIEKQRVVKLTTTNALNRFDLWEEQLKVIEKISPGITTLFKDNLKQNPGLISLELDKLNDLFHEMKIFTRTTKKYIRQGCKRRGQKYIKFVGNTSEYRLKKILIELGCDIEIQYYLEKKSYDFRVGMVLIELDGPQYHGGDKDIFKDELAIKYNFKMLRIKTSELENDYKLKKKINKCLQKVR